MGSELIVSLVPELALVAIGERHVLCTLVGDTQMECSQELGCQAVSVRCHEGDAENIYLRALGVRVDNLVCGTSRRAA